VSVKQFCVLALLIACGSGCGLLAPHGPSDVARGEYYSAGEPEFDLFFIDLHRAQVALLHAPKEPMDARRSLAQSLGLTAGASDDSLKARVSQEAQKLANLGTKLRLEVPEGSPALDASATLHASDLTATSPLRPALAEQATRVVRSRNRILAAAAALERLRVRGIGLESRIPEAFRIDGPWKREEVQRNLSDGQKLITVMLARSKEVEAFDTQLLALLEAAATTDAGLGKTPAPPVSPPVAEAEDPPKRKKQPSMAAASGKTRAAPPRPKAPPAKPSAAASNDGESPTPKPTQGSAPAEIEP